MAHTSKVPGLQRLGEISTSDIPSNGRNYLQFWQQQQLGETNGRGGGGGGGGKIRFYRDNQAVVKAWQSKAPKNHNLANLYRKLFLLAAKNNFNISQHISLDYLMILLMRLLLGVAKHQIQLYGSIYIHYTELSVQSPIMSYSLLQSHKVSHTKSNTILYCSIYTIRNCLYSLP